MERQPKGTNLNAVIDDLPVPICRFLPDGTLTFVNAAFCRFLNKRPEELVGASYVPLILEPDREHIAGLLATLTRENPVGVGEHRVVAPDGQTHWFRWTARALFDGDRLREYQAVGEDGTEQKRAEEALALAAKQWQDTFDALEDMVAIIDRDYRMVQANKAILDAFGAANVLGRRCYELFHGTSEPPALCAAYRVFSTGQPVHFEWRSDRDGRWFDTFSYPIKDKDGTVRQLVHVVRDITERKNAEEALKLTQFALDRAADAVFWAGPDARLIYVNDRACQRLGYSREELLSMTAHDISPRLPREAWADHWQESKRCGSRVYESVHRTKDGRLIPVEMAINYLEIGGREFLHGCAHDLTARKQAEEQLRAYQEQLRLLASELARSEELERRRIASDLHDHVGQILALAQNKLEAMEQSARRPAARRDLEEVRRLVEDAVQKTRSLTFDLSPPILYELGLEPALAWLAEEFERRHGLPCRFEGDEQPKPLRDDLRGVLFRAACEALLNVFKHARARNVSMTVHCSEGEVRITVEDDGAGFDAAADLPHPGGRRGFGLFNIRERLSHLGGRLEVRSEPGQGTRIVLAGPLAREDGSGRIP
jgi:PAS domain S-box-containing protein